MRNWKPVLKGKVYCSSACGGGCTKKAHEKAVRESDKLAKTLGKGWKPRVWENLGWHWQVIKGNIEVTNCTFDKKTEYQAWLQTSPQIITGHHKTPAIALRALSNLMYKRRDELKKADESIVVALSQAAQTGR